MLDSLTNTALGSRHVFSRSLHNGLKIHMFDLGMNPKLFCLLNLHDSITVGDLELPSGAKALVDAGTVVVQCVEPVAELEEEAAEEPAEPEVIGEKKEEEGTSDQSCPPWWRGAVDETRSWTG